MDEHERRAKLFAVGAVPGHPDRPSLAAISSLATKRLALPAAAEFLSGSRIRRTRRHGEPAASRAVDDAAIRRGCSGDVDIVAAAGGGDVLEQRFADGAFATMRTAHRARSATVAARRPGRRGRQIATPAQKRGESQFTRARSGAGTDPAQAQVTWRRRSAWPDPPTGDRRRVRRDRHRREAAAVIGAFQATVALTVPHGHAPQLGAQVTRIAQPPAIGEDMATPRAGSIAKSLEGMPTARAVVRRR